ncbi:thioredoxin-like protein CXXS1 [Populus trichocarpa]|uniref:Thioredoxin domain-containing protein n=1 Tax=Populus trichocarpa TaxID=3694 RepID=A0A3N7FTK6_POPTR|nr:thioredoxin-like protein CXXS1 [Populus trichocarpa]
MESEATNKSRVVMVESGESWDFYISQATTQTCPIAVHFTASWCMPSVAMNPIFEDLASAHPDILFLTVDVDAVKVINSLFDPRIAHI